MRNLQRTSCDLPRETFRCTVVQCNVEWYTGTGVTLTDVASPMRWYPTLVALQGLRKPRVVHGVHGYSWEAGVLRRALSVAAARGRRQTGAPSSCGIRSALRLLRRARKLRARRGPRPL